MAHGVVKGSCGHVVAQCRCIEGHKHVTVLDRPCAACAKARALELDPYGPPPAPPKRWPTL